MEIPRHWRLKQQRYNLIGEICPDCDFKIFPPRDVRPDCGGEAKIDPKDIPGAIYKANMRPTNTPPIKPD